MLNISNQTVPTHELEKKIYSMKLMQTPRFGKILAYWLLALFTIAVICMFLPWQQNIHGTGKTTALNPEDRPQEVTTVIAGQIKNWYVQEGQFISRGDTILLLSEVKTDYFDPKLLQNTGRQIDAKRKSIDATLDNIRAQEQRLDLLKANLQLSTQKARYKIIQAENKIEAERADLQIALKQLEVEEDQYVRSKDQYQKQLISLNELQRREIKLTEARNKKISAENKFYVAQQDLNTAQIELNSVQADYGEKIAKTESEKSYYESYLATTEGELAEKEVKYTNVAVRNDNYVILAPQSGFIIKALKAGIGETVKEGDAVVTIQPSSPEMAVELFVKPMDVPLVTIGSEVRLEFDGWPAFQVAGWPLVSVGTFGGKVKIIDRAVDRNGKFRILVVPDPQEHPWPEQLRFGSGASGMVMLRDVPIWWEIWRQLNGFPASLEQEPKEDNGKEKVPAKKTTLPK